jgi:hypothetical protein
MNTQLPPAPPPPGSDRLTSGTWAASSTSAPRNPAGGKRKLAILAIALALAAGAGIGAFGGVRHEESRWKPIYDQAVADAYRWKTEAHRVQLGSDQYQRQLESLQKKVQASVGDLEHPRFTVWNVPQSFDAAHYLFGSVPDTFSWSLDIRSNGSPIKVLIMTDHDYACWYSNACSARWRYWGPSKNIYATWDAARGCAGYVFVITTTGPTTVIPRETITRDPAGSFTGACRG